MDGIKLHPECIKCFLDKHLGKFGDAPEEKRIEYMQGIMGILSRAEITESAPEIIARIERLQRDMFGTDDSYDRIKSHFNSLMLGKEDFITERIFASDNRLLLAAKYSMLGNYIDFGALDAVSEDKLSALLSDTSKINIDTAEYENLLRDLEGAKRMVFLTDNCGEIVTDKIFICEIKNAFPSLDITAIVRGCPVLNDATIKDATEVGLDKVVTVIDNGSAVAGTALADISEDARRIIDDADVIIAKGQGNFETLSGCGKNIYYLFLCKCIMFAKRFGVERYTGMLINDTRLN
ncbi:MAG: DUF89 family protein [Clostridia bacterium]|nr:DUF89 family protein [Clostridia bacterium]